VVLDREFVFKVLALDSLLAASAKTAIQLVIMVFTIRLVVQDVELGGCERFGACRANKAGLVVFARQPSICR
jgi:hypothetical protein